MTFTTPERLKPVELFAWLGEDELGSGEIGIKQALVPAGMIPLVATSQAKMMNCSTAMRTQARMYGKKIYLCRFTIDEVTVVTPDGEPLA